jgi:hypothetical protein
MTAVQDALTETVQKQEATIAAQAKIIAGRRALQTGNADRRAAGTRKLQITPYNPECETNMAAMCDPSIAAGMATCEDDYCVTCPEAHACDKSCRLPCMRGRGGGHRLLQAGSTAQAFTCTCAAGWSGERCAFGR